MWGWRFLRQNSKALLEFCKIQNDNFCTEVSLVVKFDTFMFMVRQKHSSLRSLAVAVSIEIQGYFLKFTDNTEMEPFDTLR